jgi:hypothetical protein
MKTVMLIESALAYINPKEQWEIWWYCLRIFVDTEKC